MDTLLSVRDLHSSVISLTDQHIVSGYSDGLWAFWDLVQLSPDTSYRFHIQLLFPVYRKILLPLDATSIREEFPWIPGDSLVYATGAFPAITPSKIPES